MKKKFDCIVIGAGIYGLYATLQLARNKKKVALIEYDHAPFQRASYINQARIHNGYHYPRSLSTAKKSHDYFVRFNPAYNFAVYDSFKKFTDDTFALDRSSEEFEKRYSVLRLFSIMTDADFFRHVILEHLETYRGVRFETPLLRKLYESITKREASQRDFLLLFF